MTPPNAATRRFYSAFYQWNHLGGTVSRATPHGRHVGYRCASGAARSSAPEDTIAKPWKSEKGDVIKKESTVRFYMDAAALAAFRAHRASAFQYLMENNGCRMSANQMAEEKGSIPHTAMSVLVSGSPSALDSALKALRHHTKKWCESLAIPLTTIYRRDHRLTDADANHHALRASTISAIPTASGADSAPARMSNPWGTEKRVSSGQKKVRLHIGEAALKAFRAHKAKVFVALVRSTGCTMYGNQMHPGNKGHGKRSITLYGHPTELREARRELQYQANKWCEDLGISPVTLELHDWASGQELDHPGLDVPSEEATSTAPDSTITLQSTTAPGQAIPSRDYPLSDASSVTVETSRSQRQKSDTSGVERASEAPAASLITGKPFWSQAKPSDVFTMPSTTSSKNLSQEGLVRRLSSGPVSGQTCIARTVHHSSSEDHEPPASSVSPSKASELQRDEPIAPTSGQAQKPTNFLRDKTPRPPRKSTSPITTPSSTERHCLIIPSTFVPHLSLNESSALRSAKESSGCIYLQWLQMAEKSEARVQAVGTPNSIAQAQKYLQSIITQACIDKGIEDVKISSVSEATIEKQLSDNMRAALRMLTNPAVVLTTYENGIASRDATSDNATTNTSQMSAEAPSSDAMSGFHGVTVSSITPVTLSPQPIISFNLAADSRTFTALESTGKLHLHFLAATPLGAKIADTFAKPYDSPAKPFQQLSDTGNVAVYQSRGRNGRGRRPPGLFSEGVLARLFAVTGSAGSRAPQGMKDIEVPSSVRVGNKVVVFARVVDVKAGSQERGLEGLQALAYAGGAYRGLGGAIVPSNEIGEAFEKAETSSESVQGAEAVRTVEGGWISSPQIDATDFFDAISGELDPGDENGQYYSEGESETSNAQESAVEVEPAQDVKSMREEPTASGTDPLQTHASKPEAQGESYPDELAASSLEDLEDVLGEEYDQLPGYEDQASAIEMGQQLEFKPGPAPEEAALAMEWETKENDPEVDEADEVVASGALQDADGETPESHDQKLGQPPPTTQPARGNNSKESRFERASMPSAPSFFGTKTIPPPKHGGANMSTANLGLSSSRYFSTSSRPLASSNTQPDPETLQQTVAEFFGPTIYSKRQPRTRHILNSRRIIGETYAQLAALQGLETQQEQTQEQLQQMPEIFKSPSLSPEVDALSPEEQLAAHTAFLERKIEHHTRRMNRSLAKFSAKDLRDMLDTGHVDHRLVAYMESQVEKGLQIAKSDAERARLALANGELDKESFEQVKERILMDYEVLAAELGRLRQVLEEELDDFRDEDD